MSYVNKRIQSLINRADVCGGGMKKSGLVYGSDWTRVPGSIVLSKTPSKITFSVYGAMNTLDCCGSKATSNLNPSQGAYRRRGRGAFN
jgi:hypothetical protein